MHTYSCRPTFSLHLDFALPGSVQAESKVSTCVGSHPLPPSNLTMRFWFQANLKLQSETPSKTSEFSLAWCQKWEKLHILHALGMQVHGNISKTLIILSGDFRSHVLHSLAHINHKFGTSVLISIIFDTILLSSVWLNMFYIESQIYKQFNNSALKLSICRNVHKTTVSVLGYLWVSDFRTCNCYIMPSFSKFS